MDYAKKHHVAMFCNGDGDIIRKPFPVKNSPEGIDYLVGQVKRSCAHRSIQLQHVFFSTLKKKSLSFSVRPRVRF